MTPEELKARIFDLAKRNELAQQDLEAAYRNNQYLRAQLATRPTRSQYQTLAAELDQVRRERDALLQRNRALSRTM